MTLPCFGQKPSERCRDTPKQIQGQVYKCGDLQAGKRRLRTWYLGGHGELGLELGDSPGTSCDNRQSPVRGSVPQSCDLLLVLTGAFTGGLKLEAYT
ncbi:unnamed protein product [Rangifer tarandus platyrhynchus]|uniref:Uncharacterized protein n=1 Tax=Rangifer tarandus platyrhynchus TaxID=3082113 RepID=A0AC59YAC4_RANTA